MKLQANGLSIEAEDEGDSSQPAVLLITGLGLQLIAWPRPFIDALRSEGFRVIRFDNRDAGLSQGFDEAGVPHAVWDSFKYHVGLPLRPPYQLHDMAADALGVLDALGVAQAHVVGISLGGMVAQRLALAAPERVRSLASIMSTSGSRWLPGPRPQVLRLLLSRPHDATEDSVVAHQMQLLHAIGSPGFPTPEAQLRELVTASVRRAYRPEGVLRQMAAVAADSHRARELNTISLPTLVVHGLADPLLPPACGRDTARRIAGAQLALVAGMGHDLAPGVVDQLLACLLPHLKQASNHEPQHA